MSAACRLGKAVRHLIHTVVSLPLLDVKVRVGRALGQALVITRLGVDLSAHKRGKLKVLEVLRHGIGAHFVPLNDVSSESCVATHGTSPVSLVEALVDILGRQLQVTVESDVQG